MQVHHLAFRTTALDSVVTFYQELLGLPLVKHKGESAWLKLDHGVLMIERRAPFEPEIHRNSMELVAFRVDEHEHRAVRERLALRGVEVESETPHTLYFRDPDGRRVAISTHPLDS